jgi:hypothetical protein
MAETHMSTCKTCGNEYDATRHGRRNSTVNCPSCRGGSSSAGPKATKTKQMAGKPRDMRGHLWEHHNFSPRQMDEWGDLDAAHQDSHDSPGTYGVTPHTHGIFNDRRTGG